MFQDLDATLKALLRDPAAPPSVRAADVSFTTPDKDFKPAQLTVNLFLYDVQENRVLRDERPIVEKLVSGYVSRRPPLRVDCTYLVTAWSHQTGGVKVDEEHRLLGQALLWFSRFPVIADRFLQGGLVDPPQLYPLPASVGPISEGQGMGQFWTALGIAPRPAVSLRVTVGLQLSTEVEQWPSVREIHIDTTLNVPRP